MYRYVLSNNRFSVLCLRHDSFTQWTKSPHKISNEVDSRDKSHFPNATELKCILRTKSYAADSSVISFSRRRSPWRFPFVFVGPCTAFCTSRDHIVWQRFRNGIHQSNAPLGARFICKTADTGISDIYFPQCSRIDKKCRLFEELKRRHNEGVRGFCANVAFLHYSPFQKITVRLKRRKVISAALLNDSFSLNSIGLN